VLVVWLVSDTKEDVSVAGNVQFFLKVIISAVKQTPDRSAGYRSSSKDVLNDVGWYGDTG